MEFNTIPSDGIIKATMAKLAEHGMDVELVATKEEALKRIKELIPDKAAVMNGSSTTLIQIGFSEMLKSGNHPWNNLHKDILAEKDKAKQADMRRGAIAGADVFLASPNAITEEGQLVAVDATGSRTGAFPFVAKKLLLVAGAQKIVPDLATAMRRIREYVFPRENERAKKAYGAGSSMAKWVIIEREFVPHRIHLILVKENLGF